MDTDDSYLESVVPENNVVTQALESPEVIRTKILEFLTLLKESLPKNGPSSAKIDSILKLKNGLDIFCEIAAQVLHLDLHYGTNMRENLFNVQKLVFLMDPEYWNRFKTLNDAYCKEIDAELKKFTYEIYEKVSIISFLYIDTYFSSNGTAKWISNS